MSNKNFSYKVTKQDRFAGFFVIDPNIGTVRELFHPQPLLFNNFEEFKKTCDSNGFLISPWNGIFQEEVPTLIQ